MSRALVIAPTDDASLAKTIAAAHALNMPCDVLSFDADISHYEKIATILVADQACYRDLTPENISLLVAELSTNYTHILAPSSSFAKDFMPRVAALCDAPQISDVIEVIDQNTFKHPIYAGNAIETVQVDHEKIILTIRASAFEAVNTQTESIPVEKLSIEHDTKQVTLIKTEMTQSERPELNQARVVISGGRGVGDKKHFELLETLADCVGGAVGATRAVVDAGMVPNDLQIGQTGKIVAPELYIAIGISGAIQHIAGIKESKVIVAINKDPDAPIFKVANYGLVGDLFEIVPELIKQLKEE